MKCILICQNSPHGDEDGASFRGTVLTLEQRNVKTEIFIRSKGTWKRKATKETTKKKQDMEGGRNENITNL
jgi:hypothetical protein